VTRQPLLKARKPRKTPEANLQATVVQHIRLCGVPNLVWGASMNGVKLGIRAAARMKAQGMEAGEPDLYFVIAGHYYGLELKNGKKGVQSPVQKDREKRTFASGGTYSIARDIDQALELLEAWGALRPRTVTHKTYRLAA
jgi:hypothetical protein